MYSLLLNSVYVIFKVDLAFTRLHHLLRWRQQKLLLLTGKGQKMSLLTSLTALCCSCSSGAKSALRSCMQPCKFCRNHQKHPQNADLSQESDWEGQSHWLTPQEKVDRAAITPKLDSINLSTSSCSGNFTSGFSGPAFIEGKKRQPKALQPPGLNPVSTANTKHRGFCLVSYLQLDLPQQLVTAMCRISSLAYPPQSHWDFIQRNSAQCGEW